MGSFWVLSNLILVNTVFPIDSMAGRDNLVRVEAEEDGEVYQQAQDYLEMRWRGSSARPGCAGSRPATHAWC